MLPACCFFLRTFDAFKGMVFDLYRGHCLDGMAASFNLEIDSMLWLGSFFLFFPLFLILRVCFLFSLVGAFFIHFPNSSLQFDMLLSFYSGSLCVFVCMGWMYVCECGIDMLQCLLVLFLFLEFNLLLLFLNFFLSLSLSLSLSLYIYIYIYIYLWVSVYVFV